MPRTSTQALQVALVALVCFLIGCGDGSTAVRSVADGGTDGGVQIDACVPGITFRDADRDGYGDPAVTQESCAAQTGFVDNADDCDDECENCFPGRPERCDGIEQRGYLNRMGGCLLSGTSCLGYWTAGVVVECGGSGVFQDCESAIVDGGLACVEAGTAANRRQVCR
jgi:hypothetical protein